MNQSERITVEEIAGELSVSVPTIYAMLKKGKIPNIRQGKLYIVSREAVGHRRRIHGYRSFTVPSQWCFVLQGNEDRPRTAYQDSGPHDSSLGVSPRSTGSIPRPIRIELSDGPRLDLCHA